MMISGHKTNAMLLRYDIIPTSDIMESGQQADTLVEETATRNAQSF